MEKSTSQENPSCKTDRWGHAISTKSDACISYINSYYEQVLGYGANSDIIFKATKEDNQSVLANTLAAHTSSCKRSSNASSFLHVAKMHLGVATAYEKMVFDAVSCLINKDDDDVAFGAHLKLLCNFPKDLVSLKRGQILCFYMGRPDLSLQLVEQVLSSNEGERYIYGMFSFALLEVGRMRDAEFAAKRGLLIKSDDPWSQHALCHVLQYDCRFKEAIDFMEQHSESWNFCCPFMYVHNWWHLALCYVESDADLNSVLNIYDNRILVSLKRENVDASQVYLNALGLLLTLHVRRHSSIIKDKVKYLADGLVDKSLWHQEWQLDLFVVWAFSYSNKASQAEQCLDGMKRRVTHMRESKSQRFKNVLLLAESLYYYGKSDYHQAYNVLGKGFNVCDCKVMGASNEQLDVFEGARLDILIKSDHISEAIEALENSTSLHGGSTLTRCLLERAYSSINSGDASTKDAA